MEGENHKQQDINDFMSAMNGEVDQKTKDEEKKKVLTRALDLYKKQKSGTITPAEEGEIKLLAIKHGTYRDFFQQINAKIESSDEIRDDDQFLDSIMQSK